MELLSSVPVEYAAKALLSLWIVVAGVGALMGRISWAVALFPVNVLILVHSVVKRVHAGWAGEGLSRGSRKVAVPPGHLLLVTAEFLCSPRTYEEVFKPTVDDMRIEYFAAYNQGRRKKAAWIRMRGTWSIVAASGMLSVVKLGKVVLKAWRVVT